MNNFIILLIVIVTLISIFNKNKEMFTDYNWKKIKDYNIFENHHIKTKVYKNKYDENGKFIDYGINECLKHCNNTCMEFGYTGDGICFIKDN
jgi:hypothetical protein